MGAKLRKVQMENGVEAWAVSPAKYVEEAVTLVKKKLVLEGNNVLARKISSPFAAGFRPELDDTKPLSMEDANYYQLQIGVLQRMVEIGLIDIITKVSMLALQMAMPQEGHLAAVY